MTEEEKQALIDEMFTMSIEDLNDKWYTKRVPTSFCGTPPFWLTRCHGRVGCSL